MVDILVTGKRRECVDRGRVLGYSILVDGLTASHIAGRETKRHIQKMRCPPYECLGRYTMRQIRAELDETKGFIVT